MSAFVEAEIRPPSPFRLPARGSEDGVQRVSGGVVSRFLTVSGSPVLVRAWQPDRGRVAVRAEPVDPGKVTGAGADVAIPADRERLELALERMRFALAVDDDLGEFFGRFRRDPFLGPRLRRRPDLRPRRRPWAWEAFAWAVVKQLIDSPRAARIQRRVVGRWGPRLESAGLRDMPGPELIAGRAPAEIESMGLVLKRALALRAGAAEFAAGRCGAVAAGAEQRLRRIPEIGPWTVQCLGLFGHGDPDSLPAGDLIYLKLVGRLAGLGRRATVEEVEEFYAPYAPFRGLAAIWSTTAQSQG